ncbi:MAG: pyridoxamine 5'-phosphate oxidase [Thermoleophilaceae bacterium]|nr:pyridoxamine 5'-phosphate oxidase [Thermoleophilaceae bacterium]
METRTEESPLERFHAWFAEAQSGSVPQPEAIALATAARGGAPSLRMVLLKQADERGFAFFTNLGSRKARELAENPRAALLVFWQPLGRQIRIEGAVEPVARDEVVRYARSRSRDSQLSALASPQSEPVESREWLEERVSELREAHPEGDLPVSEDWGGFRLVPDRYEFWEHGPARLHHRLEYVQAGDGWETRLLAP